MEMLNNPLEIYHLLNRSNCMDCHEKTCMAFAVAVFKNKRRLQECPHLSPEILHRYGDETRRPNTIDEDMAAAVENRKNRIKRLDLSEAARRLEADFDNTLLTLRVFGRDVSVDPNGNLITDIHVNPWIAAPLLDYILEGRGGKPTGKWMNFRELKGGLVRSAHFRQRCEQPLKQIADMYPELFTDLLEIFDGKRTDSPMRMDICIVLQPLPLVPMLIGYWYPEEELESSLHILFDEAVQDNLAIDSLYTLCEGIVMMFGKIARRHGER